MKSTRFLISAMGLALGLSVISQPSAAEFWFFPVVTSNANKTKPKAVTPAVVKKAATPSSTTFTPPGLVDKSYPNGRGWTAVEADFQDLRGRVDGVKDDTETILLELDSIDADLSSALSYLSKIDGDIADLGEDVAAVKESVEALKNTLQLQVSISTRDANDMNGEPVWAFVQVSQNGSPVLDLEAGAFLFASSFGPNGFIEPDEVFYCGASCFHQGAAGLYLVALSPDVQWEAGTYAGTLAVALDDSTTGTSLIQFEVPVEPLPVPEP